MSMVFVTELTPSLTDNVMLSTTSFVPSWL